MAEGADGGGIEIRNLFKVFGPRPGAHIAAVRRGMSKSELLTAHRHVLGLRDINIAMPGGKIQVIMGLSGSGKSTLIRHVNRLIEPTAGQILVDGVDVVRLKPRDLRHFRRTKAAMVFQKFGLFPHRTVLDNVRYGLQLRRVPRARQLDTSMRWIESVGLKNFEGHYPNQLSGGMQQRVGLARALAIDAPVLLMDEAFSALDPIIRLDMQGVLLDLQKEIRKTIVFITHDLDEALRLGNRIAILRDGDVVQQGTNQDIILRPADSYVANFVKEVNRGRVIQVASVMDAPAPRDCPAVRVGATCTLDDAAKLLARSESDVLAVTDEAGEVVGTVSLKRVVGAMTTPLASADTASALTA